MDYVPKTERDDAFYRIHNLSCPFDIMRFYLVYRGQLSSNQGKRGKSSKERKLIRKQISPQMKRLWETSRPLRQMRWDACVPDPSTYLLGTVSSPFHKPLNENIGLSHDPLNRQNGLIDLTAPIERHGKKFRPLVRASMDMTCSLNILFLRQEDPGSLLKDAGDIDNRIKTFIDALEMPAEKLDGDENDEMNFPLLENDSLVRGIEIDTERLLLPDQEFPNQVHLVVEVVIHLERVGPWNVCLL